MKANAKHLILDLLLAFDEALSAKDAIAACQLFGVSDNSVRVALARLSAEGLIEAAERATYRLSATALELAGDVATWRTAEQRVRTWNGGLYSCIFRRFRTNRPHRATQTRTRLTTVGL
jgi:phenylacetic acid degradation operon negative regulatory protein